MAPVGNGVRHVAHHVLTSGRLRRGQNRRPWPSRKHQCHRQQQTAGDGEQVPGEATVHWAEYTSRCCMAIRVLAERKSAVEGQGVSVRVELGGRRTIKNKKYHILQTNHDANTK